MLFLYNIYLCGILGLEFFFNEVGVIVVMVYVYYFGWVDVGIWVLFLDVFEYGV